MEVEEGGWELPTEKEVEAAHTLLDFPNTWPKLELVSRTTFTWGFKKKRSVLLDMNSESLSQLEKSPSTPLSFLPTGGGDHKPPSPGRIVLKRKATDDLMEVYNKLQQEKKETLININYPRNMEDDYHMWDSCMKTNDQQRCHQQVTMFAPATPQDPNNEKPMAVSCSSNNNGGDSFGRFNQMDPRVNIHGKMYDFMGCSQPLDQSKYLVMDSELRVRAATAAARRKLRMKQNKNNSLLCHETIKFKSL